MVGLIGIDESGEKDPKFVPKNFLLSTQLFSPTRLLNFGKISAYSSVPNRLAGPNKSAGGKILEKE